MEENSDFCLPLYRVRARNTASESENKIHDDLVAAQYGFRGALVPGVAVYGYMTVPIVARFGRAWLERGAMQVKFHQPVYDGDEVTVRAELDAASVPIKVAVEAGRDDGVACATGLATVDDSSAWLGEPRLDDYPEAALPPMENRPTPSRETLRPGTPLGTLRTKLLVPDLELLEGLGETLPIYFGPAAPAHPMALLALANMILVRNFRLGPWIHAASELINHGAAINGEGISVRGLIRDVFERKGHEFVVLDLLFTAAGDRIVQHVRHTAIYQPRPVETRV